MSLLDFISNTSFEEVLLYRFQLTDKDFYSYHKSNEELIEALYNKEIDLNDYTNKKLELDKIYDYKNNKKLLINLYNIDIKDHLLSDEEADDICSNKFFKLMWNKVKKFYYSSTKNDIMKKLNIVSTCNNKENYGFYYTREGL